MQPCRVSRRRYQGRPARLVSAGPGRERVLFQGDDVASIEWGLYMPGRRALTAGE
jgi:hypothetical protein